MSSLGVSNMGSSNAGAGSGAGVADSAGTTDSEGWGSSSCVMSFCRRQADSDSGAQSHCSDDSGSKTAHRDREPITLCLVDRTRLADSRDAGLHQLAEHHRWISVEEPRRGPLVEFVLVDRDAERLRVHDGGGEREGGEKEEQHNHDQHAPERSGPGSRRDFVQVASERNCGRDEHQGGRDETSRLLIQRLRAAHLVLSDSARALLKNLDVLRDRLVELHDQVSVPPRSAGVSRKAPKLGFGAGPGQS